jgi:hypothetical protein
MTAFLSLVSIFSDGIVSVASRPTPTDVYTATLSVSNSHPKRALIRSQKHFLNFIRAVARKNIPVFLEPVALSPYYIITATPAVKQKKSGGRQTPCRTS